MYGIVTTVKLAGVVLGFFMCCQYTPLGMEEDVVPSFSAAWMVQE